LDVKRPSRALGEVGRSQKVVAKGRIESFLAAP
jgi:hypothetical protein